MNQLTSGKQNVILVEREAAAKAVCYYCQTFAFYTSAEMKHGKWIHTHKREGSTFECAGAPIRSMTPYLNGPLPII